MKTLESLGLVTARDYNAYVRFNLLKGRYYRIKSLSAIVLVGIACAILFLCGFAYEDKAFFIYGGILLLCTAMFSYVVKVNVRNFCKNKSELLNAEQKAVFGKNGFIHEVLYKDNPERNEIFFDDISRFYVTKNTVYVYVESKSVIILPGRNLNMTRAETVDFLKKYLPPHKLVVCV